MNDTGGRVKPAPAVRAFGAAGLAHLEDEARRDLERLNYPAPNWVPPREGRDGRAALDVLVIGGGMCGQTLAFALQREGVRNIRVVDKAAERSEGPWSSFARMETLRSPKHLTGADLGVPSLTFRAWHEAQNGPAGWADLRKAGRLDWAAYLYWLRGMTRLPVENGVEATHVHPAEGGLLRVDLTGPRGPETVHARKLVLAGGRAGAGASRVLAFPSMPGGSPSRRVFHSADAVDFEAYRGGRIGVLGAGASAFDNAATALESGVAEATMFVRRPHLPQVNKSKWTAFPGFLRGFQALDDERRWRFYTYIFGQQVPPPHESVLRCDRHPGFSIRFGEPWLDVAPDEAGVTVTTARGAHRFEAVLLGTGFDVDLSRRPELAAFTGAIRLWGDRVSPHEAAAHPEAARFPYLGAGFEFNEREPGAAPALRDIHLFNWGATMSHGALAGDIPGLGIGAARCAEAIVRDLFLADADLHYQNLLGLDDAELKPTRYYVEPADRRG